MARQIYTNIQRRRREGKTNYKSRRAALLSRNILIVPRFTSKYVLIQFINPTITGDIVIASFHSKKLSTYGWKGSGNNIPASYLSGLVSGHILKEKPAILYVGVQRFVPGSRLAAVLKGLLDAKVNVNVNEEIFPPSSRINGEHISSYADSISNDSKDLKQPFNLLKTKLDPVDYPKHFKEVKENIVKNFSQAKPKKSSGKSKSTTKKSVKNIE